jgi:Homeodomain-like domain
MGEDRLAMSHKERDRLKVLHEVSKGQITQKQAADQLKLSERQVRRMLKKLKISGDAAVIHGLRGQHGNRRLSEEIQKRAIQELSRPECLDFGPTFAAEHLLKRLDIDIGKDTVRKWMTAAALWKPRRRKAETIHQWRQRRCCAGELVQWDTSVHDWLEGRGERLYLIAMIDDATSRVFARFVRQDTAAENLRVLWSYLEAYGRPLSFYTDKAGMFEVTPKHAEGKDRQEMAPTQITRALAELGIERISAHSPQAKGRIERFFETAQDRLVKELRVAGVSTIEAANQYLVESFLPDWQQRFTVAAANPTDAHRPLTELHDLAASLSHVETRTVTSDYTLQFQSQRYQIARDSVSVGLRGQQVRVEARLDGSVAVRFQGRYLEVTLCGPKTAETPAQQLARPVRKDHNRGGRSNWMRDYPLKLSRSARQSTGDSSRNC